MLLIVDFWGSIIIIFIIINFSVIGPCKFQDFFKWKCLPLHSKAQGFKNNLWIVMAQGAVSKICTALATQHEFNLVQ